MQSFVTSFICVFVHLAGTVMVSTPSLTVHPALLVRFVDLRISTVRPGSVMCSIVLSSACPCRSFLACCSVLRGFSYVPILTVGIGWGFLLIGGVLVDLPEGLRRPREVANNLVSAIASGSLSADDAAEALSSVFVLDYYSNRWFPRLDGSWTVVAPSGVSRDNVPVARFIPPASEPPATVVAPPAVAAPTTPPAAPPPAPGPPSPPQAPVVPISGPGPVESPAAPLQEPAPARPPASPPAAPVFGAPAAPDSEKPGSPSLPPGSSGPASLAALREQRFLEEQSLPVVAVPPGATSSVFDSAPMVEFEKTEQAPRPVVRQSSSRSSSRKNYLPTSLRVARSIIITLYVLGLILSLPALFFFSSVLTSSTLEGVPGAAVFSSAYLVVYAGAVIPIIATLVYLFSGRFRPAGIIILIPTYLAIFSFVAGVGLSVLNRLSIAGWGSLSEMLFILPFLVPSALILWFFWWAGTVFYKNGEPDTVMWPIIFLCLSFVLPFVASIVLAFL